eukprot:3407917-Pleurochrysis_carterae.AAC.4
MSIFHETVRATSRAASASLPTEIPETHVMPPMPCTGVSDGRTSLQPFQQPFHSEFLHFNGELLSSLL